MKKSDIHQPPCYFDKYLSQVEDIELAAAFQYSQTQLEAIDLAKWNRVGNAVYAAGKWTIKDILQHLIDTEHILAYRALRIARNDPTPLTGFDEAVLAANVSTAHRTLESLIDELKLVREVTALIFATFNDEALLRPGIASGIQMSALAFGFTIVGHQIHHCKIINEKYLTA
jgi:DinB superfamily